jgi:rubrerythrin
MTEFDFDSTRGQFLRNTGKGAVGLAVGGTLLAMTEGVAFGQTSADVEIAKVAATAELLAIDVYTRALAAKSAGKVIFAGATRKYLLNARKNEVVHYNTLKGVLKGDTPSGLTFKYAAGTFSSASKIVDLGVTLETAFVRAYITAAKALSTEDLRLVAAQIGASEASHLGFLLNAQGQGKTLSAIPKPFTDAEFAATVKVVKSFIK